MYKVKWSKSMDRRYDFEDDDVTINYTLNNKPDSDKLKNMHAHEKYEMLLFLSGKGTYYVEGTPYSLHFGDVLIMRENEFHCVHIKPNVPYERVVMHFSKKFIEKVSGISSLLNAFDNRPLGKHNKYHINELISEHPRYFIDELLKPAGNKKVHAVTCVLKLLNGIEDNFMHKQSLPQESNMLSYEVISYVNNHLIEDISLQDICDEFFISKSQLCRLFKKATGATVWDYIITKRLVLAKSLINSGESATTACYKAGFNDYTSFFRAYKTKYSVSPKSDKGKVKE